MTSTDSPTQIRTIVIPTCNRVGVLRRGLSSYIESGKQFGRCNDYVISDDTRGAETRAACRQMLGELKQRYGVEVRYAGMEEKLRYAKRLIEEGAAPAGVIKFALFDSERLGLSTLGANRNALLLHTIGDLILTVDDDTVCSVTPSPDLRPGIRRVSHRNFFTYLNESTWIYPNRETLLESITFTSEDLLAIHEQMLGRDLNDFVESAGEPASMCSHSTAAPEAASGRINATATGLAGDSTWPSPFVYFLLTGPSRQRLARSEKEYQAALLSREVLRVTDSITIADWTDATPGAAFGLDNREMLPPFMPVAVAEDLVFWRTLLKCSSGAYIAHLPWALLHLPDPPRRHRPSDLMKGTMGVEFYIVLLALMSHAERDSSCAVGERGVKKLGGYLETIASMPRRDFDQFAHESVLQEVGLLVSYLEDQLSTSEGVAHFWAADIERIIRNMRASFSRAEVSVPLDLLRNRTLDEAREMTQRLVLKFGQLLRWWPDMIEAARKLKREGYSVAHPVSPHVRATHGSSVT